MKCNTSRQAGHRETAREEKTRARDANRPAQRGNQKNDAAYDARMAQLYREVVLKEKPATSDESGFIPLGAIAPAGNGHSNGNGARRRKFRSQWLETSCRLLATSF